MKKRLILAAAFAILVFNLVVKVRADFYSSDLGISQRLFRASVDKGLVLCNSFLAFADSEWEKSSLGKKVWNGTWEMLPVVTFAERDFGEETYLSEYLQQNGLEVTPLEAAVLAENEAVSKTANETLNGTETDSTFEFIPAAAPQAVYSRQQLQDEGFVKGTF